MLFLENNYLLEAAEDIVIWVADLRTCVFKLGQTPLDARALLKSLANITSAVETFREDVGRTRITK